KALFFGVLLPLFAEIAEFSQRGLEAADNNSEANLALDSSFDVVRANDHFGEVAKAFRPQIDLAAGVGAEINALPFPASCFLSAVGRRDSVENSALAGLRLNEGQEFPDENLRFRFLGVGHGVVREATPRRSLRVLLIPPLTVLRVAHAVVGEVRQRQHGA